MSTALSALHQGDSSPNDWLMLRTDAIVAYFLAKRGRQSLLCPSN